MSRHDVFPGTWGRVPVVILLALVLLALGFWKTVLVLEIGAPGLRLSVHQGDVVICTYIHSIYDVPVSEKLRVEDGYFKLFHVTTESDAVLAFLGLDRKDGSNVDREFKEFTVNAASQGGHVLTVHGRDIPLKARNDQASIHVRLIKAPLVARLTHLIWR